MYQLAIISHILILVDFIGYVCLNLEFTLRTVSSPSGVTIQPSSPKSHIWRILSEKRTEKCSHSHLCCAFSARFSLNLRSNLAFYQDFKIVVNRYPAGKFFIMPSVIKAEHFGEINASPELSQLAVGQSILQAGLAFQH
jgi:hypothetical protein